MLSNPGSLEERKAAALEYLAAAEDRAAALAFLGDCLDPITDAALLAWLDEQASQTPETSNP